MTAGQAAGAAPVGVAAGVGRSAAVMGVATAVSRLLGFVRVLVVAAVLGTTYLGNTFQASNAVSNVIFELLAAGALSAVLVPGFVDLVAQRRGREAEELAGALLGVALLVLGALSVAGVLAAPVIARVLTTGVRDPAVAARQQELATFLLRFFVPQIVLYAVGTVATAVLHAQRRFTITAVAPIGNTVVLVAGMLAFRALRGGRPPSLSLSVVERTTLGLAGTLGVAAFVAIPAIAVTARGFRLRPRLGARDPRVRRMIGMAAWATFQNAGVGVLLGAAILVGMATAGGVVAYQVAFVFFLAPYAVLAQPIHTAILPELAEEAAAGDAEAFDRSLRWGLDAMALLVVPVTAAFLALGLPLIQAVSFGHTTPEGVRMIAAALGGLGLGLFPYGAFLLLTRACYALGDSRTPTLVAVASAALGAAFMVVVGSGLGAEGRLAALGLGHTVAYTVAALGLAVVVARRTGRVPVPRALARAVPAAAVVAAAAWALWEVVAPVARAARLGTLAVAAGAGALAYAALVHPPSLRRLRPAPGGPEDLA